MLYSEAKTMRAEIMRLDRDPNSGARVMSRNAMRGINNHIAAVAYALGGRQNVAEDFPIPDNNEDGEPSIGFALGFFKA